MKTEIVTITPKMAGELLNANLNNRPKSMRRAKILAEIMRRGEWIFNGDTIRVSESGVLLDGQHRLTAIVESGIPQKSILVTGLEDDSFKTIDTGKGRTGGDVLAIEGIANYNVVAAAVYLMLLWIKTGNPTHGNPDNKPTKSQILEYVRSNHLCEYSGQRVGSKGLSKLSSKSILAFCHMVFLQDDEDFCEEFFSALESGHSYESSPIIHLRDKLIASKVSKTHRLQKHVEIALIFSAYRAFKKHLSVTRLRLPSNQSDWFKLS